MLKGIMEGCILAVIEEGEVYGYELSLRLQRYGFPEVSEGSIYPLLLRLQKENLIRGTLHKSPSGGPPRKYYHLTEEGTVQLMRFRQQWTELSSAVNRVIQGKRK
ncbi:PadR family transcriptional regulator [Kroppenstedtia eburnea]|nr:PadR family transcriptional regulator [Kroppenstedtia eburnea]